jgi:hypothetical protein
MNLYKSSQVYTSIARLIIKPNFMFTVDSLLNQPNSNRFIQATC